MRILGIDPGSWKTGYGLIESKDFSVIACGTICLPRTSHAQSLGVLWRELENVFSQNRPDCVIVERIFYGRSIASALVLGQARGVALAAAGFWHCDCHEYTACEVKGAVAGHGHASKEAVAAAVRMYAKFQGEFDTLDASDALALALCHMLKPAKKKKRLSLAESLEHVL